MGSNVGSVMTVNQNLIQITARICAFLINYMHLGVFVVRVLSLIK